MNVRECGQDLSLFAIWNECVHMGGGVVYILCEWSVVRPTGSTGDCSQPSRECDSEKDLEF